jgi:phosphoribosylanthranilate isomerase
VKDKADLKAARNFRTAGAFLLDAQAEKEYGGTGRSFDWEIARQAKSRLKKPLILAGGLNPGNVAEAVRTVRPWAVDVSRGVEKSPGRKDGAALHSFIAAAKAA